MYSPGRWIQRLLLGLGALLLLALLTWWAVPALLVWQLPPRLSALLGRPVTLQSADFVPWRLDLTLQGLQIGAAPGQAGPPLLQLARLRADLDIASLRHLAPVVQALEIDGLRLNVARTAAGHYDIDDLLARFAKPPAPPDAAATEPERFALYNLALRDAQIHFDDRPASKQHALQALTLTLPFVSNLPGDVDIHTEPRLAFTVNGTRFDSGSQALPFARTRSGEFRLDFADLDLKPWLGYLPAGLPVQLQAARLGANLKLRFAVPAQGPPSVSLQGRLGLKQLAVAEPDGTPLASWDSLTLELRDVQPLAHQVALGTLQIDGAALQIRRDAQGQLNLQRLGADKSAGPADSAAAAQAPASTQAATTNTAASASASTAGTASAGGNTAKAQPADTSPWQLRLDTLQINGARVRWTDAAVQPQAALQIDGIGLKAGPLQWPAPAPVPLRLAATLRPQAEGAAAAGQLVIEGQAHDQAATLALQLSGLDLAALSPYLAQALVPRLSGQLALQGKLNWAGGDALALSLDSATLDRLQLHDGAAPRAPSLAALQQLQINGVEVNLAAHKLEVAKVQLLQPVLALARDPQGRLNIQQWAVAAPASKPAARPAPPVKATPTAKNGPGAAPWQIKLQDLQLSGGAVSWVDAALPDAASGEPLRLNLSALKLRLQDFSWPAGGSPRAVLPRLQLAARIGPPAAAGAGRGAAGSTGGQIDWNGRFGLAPPQADGQLKLQRLPVHLLARYAAAALPVSLVHAEAGFQGRLQLRESSAGWQAATGGDLQINELQVNTRATAGQAADSGNELLSWQSLGLQGLQVALAPPARPRIEVRELLLNDFYSRLVITEQGRFNLQDMAATAPDDGGATTPAAAASAATVGAAAAPQSASTAAAAPATAASAPASTDFPVDLLISSTQLRNGRVDFSDRFIRPNYSAKLTELNGSIGTLRSGTRDMASISLRGRAADTALLDISGQLNPLAQPLALDIRAKATDLELAPLSPYAGKYAGYAIERGKLSMDVAYKFDADGKLAASNQVILNQLTFGERVESPSATQLPVLLAVALLKDRHGVIDINLPISGSLSDPQFSVGGIIWKVIVNLLTKALTAPFALLSGGGSDDLSQVEFIPGTAQVTEAGRQSLGKVASALTDRPALKMTVTGAADLAGETTALRQALLEERLRTEQRRERLRAEPAAAARQPASATSAATAASAASAPVAEAAPPMSADERGRLLTRLYQQTALPDKPRSAIGTLRELPAPEMEARLLAHLPVSDETARDLALQRGLAVRDALIAQGLPSERLFLAAPRLHTAGTGEAAWTPRVELALSTR